MIPSSRIATRSKKLLQLLEEDVEPQARMHRAVGKSTDAPVVSDRELIEIGLARTSERPKPSQLEEVNQYLESKSLDVKLGKLPPKEDFTFTKIGDSRVKDGNTLDVKLYCGEVSEYQTWAIVKHFTSSETGKRENPTEVHFVNEYTTGEKRFVTDFSELALMYPFKVLKKIDSHKNEANKTHNIRDNYNLRQLKILILYLFMEHEHIAKVFPKGFKSARNYLSSAIKQISNDYDAKGIENVPNLHRPGQNFSFRRGQHAQSSISGSKRAYDDDEKTVTSVEESANIRADESSSSTHTPTADSDLTARLDTISILDQDEHQTGSKRPAEISDNMAEVLRLKRARRDLAKDERAEREQASRKRALARVKDREIKEKMRAVMAKMTPDEWQKWMLGGGMTEDE